MLQCIECLWQECELGFHVWCSTGAQFFCSFFQAENLFCRSVGVLKSNTVNDLCINWIILYNHEKMSTVLWPYFKIQCFDSLVILPVFHTLLSIYWHTGHFFHYLQVFASCLFHFCRPVHFVVLNVSLCATATGIRSPAEPQHCLSLRLPLTCHLALLFASSLIGVTVVADAEWFPESEQSCSG